MINVKITQCEQSYCDGTVSRQLKQVEVHKQAMYMYSVLALRLPLLIHWHVCIMIHDSARGAITVFQG